MLSRKRIYTAISGFFFILATLLRLFNIDGSLYIIFIFISILFAGYFVVIAAMRNLFGKRFLDINFLVIIASIGAIVINQFAEAAAVLFFFSLAKVFEEFGIERSRKALEILIKKSPKIVNLKSGEVLPVEKVKIKDIIIVRPGDLIPVDGVIIKGSSAVDEAAITGESIPHDKQTGDTVFAGTVNLNGYLEIEVAKENKDSTFAKIIKLVEQAQKSRAPIQKFIERFARYYTPLIIMIALSIIIIPPIIFNESSKEWLHRGLILLVIACPCALVVSTPVSIASAIGGALRYGILIKGGQYLEALGKLKTVAFDKTKTLTVGKLEVSDLITFNDFSQEHVLADAAGIEKFSSHPISESIVAFAKKQGVTPHTMEKFKNIPGKGAKASCLICRDMKCSIGNIKLIETEEEKINKVLKVVDRLEKEGKTVIIINKEKQVMGVIALVDKIKDGAYQTIKYLDTLNIKSVMLTGDNWNIANYTAKILGIDEVHAALLPEEKVEKIEQLKKKYGSIAMVGDGINDAPSLAAANVGIAMGATGTDVAIETADVALMHDNILNVPRTIFFGRKTLRTIKQNIVVALGVKIIFLVLAILGLTHLDYAVAADAGIAILVILHSLRLFRIQTNRSN